MFIIFNKTTKTIFAEGTGDPTESENKLYLGDTIICNDLSVCDWKYISNQRMEIDEWGNYLHDADYYSTITKPVPIEELQEQLAATNAILLDIYLGA